MFLSQNPQQNYTCLKQSSIGHYLIKHVMAKTSQNNLHFTCKNWVKVLFTIKSVGCFATEKWYSHELLPIYHYGGAGFCIDSYCFEFIIYCLLVKHIHVFLSSNNTIHIFDILASTNNFGHLALLIWILWTFQDSAVKH